MNAIKKGERLIYNYARDLNLCPEDNNRYRKYLNKKYEFKVNKLLKGEYKKDLKIHQQKINTLLEDTSYLKRSSSVKLVVMEMIKFRLYCFKKYGSEIQDLISSKSNAEIIASLKESLRLFQKSEEVRLSALAANIITQEQMTKRNKEVNKAEKEAWTYFTNNVSNWRG